jgi:hypothetical protein
VRRSLSVPFEKVSLEDLRSPGGARSDASEGEGEEDWDASALLADETSPPEDHWPLLRESFAPAATGGAAARAWGGDERGGAPPRALPFPTSPPGGAVTSPRAGAPAGARARRRTPAGPAVVDAGEEGGESARVLQRLLGQLQEAREAEQRAGGVPPQDLDTVIAAVRAGLGWHAQIRRLSQGSEGESSPPPATAAARAAASPPLPPPLPPPPASPSVSSSYGSSRVPPLALAAPALPEPLPEHGDGDSAKEEVSRRGSDDAGSWRWGEAVQDADFSGDVPPVTGAGTDVTGLVRLFPPDVLRLIAPDAQRAGARDAVVSQRHYYTLVPPPPVEPLTRGAIQPPPSAPPRPLRRPPSGPAPLQPARAPQLCGALSAAARGAGGGAAVGAFARPLRVAGLSPPQSLPPALPPAAPAPGARRARDTAAVRPKAPCPRGLSAQIC